MKTYFERWSLDYRFFYVFFADWNNEFNNNSSGPCLAVTNDFGELVESDYDFSFDV